GLDRPHRARHAFLCDDNRRTSVGARKSRSVRANRYASAQKGAGRACAFRTLKIEMTKPLYPSLYQINTRVWLTELARNSGRKATLDNVPDAELDRIVKLGFDWVWLLSVWQTGELGKQISRTIPALRKELQETLPDLTDEDIQGSGFAITGYKTHEM